MSEKYAMGQRHAMVAANPDHVHVEKLSVEFHGNRSVFAALMRQPRSSVKAVDDVTFSIAQGETLGLVGESGSGKTTVGRALLGLNKPTAGRIAIAGELIAGRYAMGKSIPRTIQMVFQDPYGSLNPRFSPRRVLSEVLAFHEIVPAREIESEVARLMDLVGLSQSLLDRKPKQLSGGQRQRVGLARALAVRPKILVLDEPVAALDVSIQAQVLNLLDDLRSNLGLTMLFIAHELGVVRHISDRVAVMYLGHVMETGTSDEIFDKPRHPYTASLLKAMPRLVAKKRDRPPVLQGEVPSPYAIPSGCRFRTRCPKAQDVCATAPPVVQLSATHTAACHFAA